MLQRLPRLFGLPWERQANGAGPGALGFLVATGSPLTKTVGQPIAVQWAVRNSGGSQGVAEIYLTNRTTGAARFLRSGPLLVNTGADVPVSLSWNTAGMAPGVYSITIAIDEVTSEGAFVRNVQAEDFDLTLQSTTITQAQVIEKARSYVLANTGIDPDGGFWATAYFVGLALLELQALKATAPVTFGGQTFMVALDQEWISDNVPRSQGWTWQQGLDWWIASGHILPGKVV